MNYNPLDTFCILHLLKQIMFKFLPKRSFDLRQFNRRKYSLMTAVTNQTISQDSSKRKLDVVEKFVRDNKIELTVTETVLFEILKESGNKCVEMNGPQRSQNAHKSFIFLSLWVIPTFFFQTPVLFCGTFLLLANWLIAIGKWASYEDRKMFYEKNLLELCNRLDKKS